MRNVNRFIFESSDRNFSQPPATADETKQYRDQMLRTCRSVMLPAVIYKGQTFERRVLA